MLSKISQNINIYLYIIYFIYLFYINILLYTIKYIIHNSFYILLVYKETKQGKRTISDYRIEVT